VMPPGRDSISASTVYNIIARIPGTNSSGAILLDAHYDTMPMTPGATDCTSCVATLLETARALQAAPPLQNDVILLFTDKEESSDDADGKEGVAAFIEQHPWASEVRQVLNFDGTGRTGPAMLIETGPNSGWLVREWGRTASQPVAQSWFYEIYRLTPLGTDFTPFANAGIGGLNFFYLFESTIYHTVLDNPDAIDPRSVQHFGSNALSMTRRLGNLDLAEAQSPGDAVYFSLVRGLLVNYPATWAIPLVLLAGLLLTGAAVAGFRGCSCRFSARATHSAGPSAWFVGQPVERHCSFRPGHRTVDRDRPTARRIPVYVYLWEGLQRSLVLFGLYHPGGGHRDGHLRSFQAESWG